MMMEHMGIRWGYVFLRASNYLNPEEFSGLMIQAVEMYLAGESERQVKHESYDGRLSTEGRYEVMGGLGGQRFDAATGNGLWPGPGHVPRKRADRRRWRAHLRKLGASFPARGGLR